VGIGIEIPQYTSLVVGVVEAVAFGILSPAPTGVDGPESNAQTEHEAYVNVLVEYF
jgi:hypothetical protein